MLVKAKQYGKSSKTKSHEKKESTYLQDCSATPLGDYNTFGV